MAPRASAKLTPTASMLTTTSCFCGTGSGTFRTARESHPLKSVATMAFMRRLYGRLKGKPSAYSSRHSVDLGMCLVCKVRGIDRGPSTSLRFAQDDMTSLRFAQDDIQWRKEKPALFSPEKIYAGSQFSRSFGRAWPLIIPLTGAA